MRSSPGFFFGTILTSSPFSEDPGPSVAGILRLRLLLTHPMADVNNRGIGIVF